ncbi:MAG: helix-turn-helix domain-containing protein [Microcoleus sp.]
MYRTNSHATAQQALTAQILGDRIRVARKSAQLGQVDLAGRIHSTQTTISNWERGVSVPDAVTLSIVAKALRVPVRDLLR